MPRLIFCLNEGTFLSEPRHEVTWEAVTELACELLSEKRDLLRRWMRRHVAAKDEVQAWTEAYFKVRSYVPKQPDFDLSEFRTPFGYDLERLAKRLGTDVRRASVFVRKLDKALMLAAAEEVLAGIRHSNQFGHRIELRKVRS
ncbi:MAG: hypothetical protein QXP81_04495 [Nitrososphaerota archaeon]|nr:hypothetical protein [Candidatus Calditenuis fumarioli]